MIGVGAAGNRGRMTRSVGGPTSELERACWIALSVIPGVGPASFAHLLMEHDSATAVWERGPDTLRGLGRLSADAMAVAESVWPGDVRREAARIEAATRRNGGRVVLAIDADYPPALLSLDPRPAVLHVAGADDAFRQRGVALVGTRRASGYGLSCAIDLAEELAAAGVAVVSGLALGIDGAAHRAAVAVGGRSIAVLPSPLDRIYPPRHTGLARTIVETGGALVTELAVGSRVGRPDFARRNRLIAGLAEAVVVVEAPDRSGALLTASAATAIGRELYAVPGQIDAVGSRGCNRLIADKYAAIVTSPASLLQQVGVPHGRRPPALETLSEVEGLLLAKLLERSGSIEELLDRAPVTASSAASALTLLEARGLVSTFGGATFHPTLAARRLSHDV